MRRKTLNVISIDTKSHYQRWETFGASACWWSQAVGGWTQHVDGGELRERLISLLYGEDGIGLTEYRYNAGAEVNFKNALCHPWRSAESFILPDGSYDFTRDKNSVWALKRAVAYGVPKITVFFNSPPDTLTLNGKTYGEPKSGNIAPENYAAFADYCFDVVEHFLADGIPVTHLSPVNEPQWKWSEPKQEGCHYETEELVALYKVFFDKKQLRPALKDVEIALPEGGEWGGETLKYIDAFMADDTLRRSIKSLDVHSYWTNARQKAAFYDYVHRKYPDLLLRNSEVCIMEHVKDLTMATALRLVNCVHEDINILNVVGWCWWLGVSDGDYKDGLLYVDTEGTKVEKSKMFYALGNFSRFIKGGDVRVGCKVKAADWWGKATVKATAFEGDDRLTLTLVNDGEEVAVKLHGAHHPHKMEIYVTDDEKDLQQTYVGEFKHHLPLTKNSVTTVVLTAEKGI